MSLFDVLRYPISNFPTREEIDNLPAAIYNEWYRTLPWELKTVRPENMHEALMLYHKKADKKNIIDPLRRIIQEYEPDDTD
jgi:hypothetical protein